MKKSIVTSCILLLALLGFKAQCSAQKWAAGLDSASSFKDMQKAFETYYLHSPSIAGQETEENGEYLQFKRWEAFVQPRLDEHGHFPAGKLVEEWEKEKAKGS